MKSDSIAIALNVRSEGGAAWIHVLPPAGTIQGRDGRTFRIRDMATVINTSQRLAGKRLMPVDYDHALDLAAPAGLPAPAAGWIDALQSRGDGVWGRVQWTDRAADHLARKEYRYLSPVFRHTADGEVTALLRAALTNNPNIDQLTALASMEEPMDPLAELRALLELPTDTDAPAIVGKVRELLTARNTATTPDPAKFVPIGDFERAVSEVNRLNQGISLQAATDHVTTQIVNGRMPTFLKDWGIALCRDNKPAFDSFMERTGGKFYNNFFGPRVARTMPPEFVTGSQLTADELALCAQMGISEKEFLATREQNSRTGQR